MTKPKTVSNRGRKSAARTAAESLQPSKQHPPPPSLTDEEATVWHQVVDSLPADHFYTSDYPILEQYCETIVDARKMRAQWNGLSTTMKSNGDEVANPQLVAINRTRAVAAALASKLRIVPSSRLSASKAGHEKETVKSKRAHLMR